MNPSTIYNGKVYVFRIKCTNKQDWDAKDIIFGIGREGDDGVSFNRFKDLSSRRNKKYFFCKKANSDTDEKCTGAEIMKALQDYFPIGSPALSFVDGPVSWYTVAKAAYENGLFTDHDSFNDLEASHEKSTTTAGSGMPDITGSGNTAADSGKQAGTATSPSTVLEKARKDADKLARNKNNSFISGFSQGARQLAGVFPPTGSPADSPDEVNWDKMSHADICRVAKDWKAKALKAEEDCAAFGEAVAQRDDKINDLKNKLDSCKRDLESAKTAQASFMAVADMKTIETEVVKKASSTVLDGLKPLIANELQPIKRLLDSFSPSFAEINTACTQINITCKF